MDQHSIRKSFLICLFASFFTVICFFSFSNVVNAGELLQIAESGSGEEGDDEDDEDC